MPVALAIGAVVFTGGAALGLALPTWGAAVAGVFGSSALGTIAAGAVTAAGYGAVIGGATSALTGKNVIKGMQVGAATGAVTGGVISGVTGSFSDPIGDAAANLGGNAGQSVGGAANSIAGAGGSIPTGGVPTGVAADAPTLTGTPQASTPASGVKGLMSTPADAAPATPSNGTPVNSFWSGAAGPIAGAALTGLGQGIASGQPDPTLAQRGANYGPGPTSVAAPGSGPATQVLNPGGRTGAQLSAATTTPSRNGLWKYDAANGEFQFIPATT